MDVLKERKAQAAKWGDQSTLPSFAPEVLAFPVGSIQEALAEEYEVPTEDRAKLLCERAFGAGRGTFAHLLVEEVAEAISSHAVDAVLRAELIQVAAVAVQWVEALDKRTSEAAP